MVDEILIKTFLCLWILGNVDLEILTAHDKLCSDCLHFIEISLILLNCCEKSFFLSSAFTNVLWTYILNFINVYFQHLCVLSQMRYCTTMNIKFNCCGIDSTTAVYYFSNVAVKIAVQHYTLYFSFSSLAYFLNYYPKFSIDDNLSITQIIITFLLDQVTLFNIWVKITSNT